VVGDVGHQEEVQEENEHLNSHGDNFGHSDGDQVRVDPGHVGGGNGVRHEGCGALRGTGCCRGWRGEENTGWQGWNRRRSKEWNRAGGMKKKRLIDEK